MIEKLLAAHFTIERSDFISFSPNFYDESGHALSRTIQTLKDLFDD